jgi:hypothetical protein
LWYLLLIILLLLHCCCNCNVSPGMLELSTVIAKPKDTMMVER